MSVDDKATILRAVANAKEAIDRICLVVAHIERNAGNIAPSRVRRLAHALRAHPRTALNALISKMSGAISTDISQFDGMTLAEIERAVIEKTLGLVGGNKHKTARMLGIGTKTLYRKLEEYGLHTRIPKGER